MFVLFGGRYGYGRWRTYTKTGLKARLLHFYVYFVLYWFVFGSFGFFLLVMSAKF